MLSPKLVNGKVQLMDKILNARHTLVLPKLKVKCASQFPALIFKLIPSVDLVLPKNVLKSMEIRYSHPLVNYSQSRPSLGMKVHKNV